MSKHLTCLQSVPPCRPMHGPSLAELAAVLGGIERNEAKLLNWGYVDGGYSKNELLALIDALRGELGVGNDAHSILAALLERGAVVRLRYPGYDLYRSRMAETVRLMAQSKQLFERHLHGNRWITAPGLVSDFRLQIKPRRYPRRDVTAAQVLEALNQVGAAEFEQQACLSLTNDRRLAGFQLRATERILGNRRSTQSSGVIITAGTGSGKTLAFYLPALTDIASRIDATRWVKSIAIYPRNELLKDQFVETYRHARLLDQVLAAVGKRKLSVGAFFGQTPEHPTDVTKRDRWGHKHGDGWLCPYMRCPTCSSDMIWRETDAQAGIERLYCVASSCGYVVHPDEVVLTRRRMAEGPPDIVFTTTEMLNRRFTDTRYRHLFGIGTRALNKPRTVLLDEVHTYIGTHGAHVGLLMRRWAHAVGGSVTFVGLSATLKDPEPFFSDLTGVPINRVEAIAPTESEMESEGMEYLVALRGDPTSGVSLLSTTIQTAMLLARALDTSERKSGGLFGERVFLFTDDLDVTNRLYYDILDAEGYDAFGRLVNDTRRPNGALANLRSTLHPDRERRLAHGQSWDMAEQVGHSLRPGSRLLVGRTSSQDVGVDSNSQLIVATAALEVGFNDPTVGGVIQHKTPHSAAAFLQRRGRAGRLRHMRPWTVVVLSDYGRDRITYQAYDQLFDPELKPRRLPVRNRYVLRMQAVYALFDWLGAQIDTPDGSIWEDLAKPPDAISHERKRVQTAERQRKVLQLVEQLLRDPSRREEVAEYLERSLRIERDEVDVVLWDAPRSVILEVLPTIRRLITGWHGKLPALPDGEELTAAPLPEYVPPALFSDLALPEVAIVTPAQTRDGEEETNFLPVAQAIREFAPGRVTRRYATRHGYVRHWVPLDISDIRAETAEIELEIRSIAPYRTEVGSLQIDDNRVSVWRPWHIQAQKPPSNISDSSNSYPTWRSDLRPRTAGGDSLPPPTPSAWGELVESIEFYTHSTGVPIDVVRAAVGANATINLKDGGSRDVLVKFTADGVPAALGFSQPVDGMRVTLRLPDFVDIHLESHHLAALRAARFQYLVENEVSLRSIAGSFKPTWLARLFRFGVVSDAIESNITLREACGVIRDNFVSKMQSVIDTHFGEGSATGEADIFDVSDGGLPSGRLRAALEDLLRDEEVQEILLSHAHTLWEVPAPEWQEWLGGVLSVTVGAAIVEACERLIPSISPGDLLVDVVATGDPYRSDVWITEATLGGAGAIEQVRSEYSQDPRRFFRVVEASLAPSDFELVDGELRRILAMLASDEGLRQDVERIRAAANPDVTHEALRTVVEKLSRAGIFACHPVIAALSARLLRPGSNGYSDALLRCLISMWEEQESRLGIEIDARTFAYCVGRLPIFDEDMRKAGLPRSNITSKIAAVYGLLWPRGWELRSQALLSYNPFAPAGLTDRLLVLASISKPRSAVDVDIDNWFETVSKELSAEGEVAVFSSSGDVQRLQRAMATIMCKPVEVGFIQVFPRLVGVKREASLCLVLELPEALQ